MPHTIWHLDEVYLKIDGRLAYLWCAVDAEGEVLDVLVQTRGAIRGYDISLAPLSLCSLLPHLERILIRWTHIRHCENS